MSAPDRQLPYLRLYRVAPTKIYTPGVPDIPVVPTNPGARGSTLTRARLTSTFSSGSSGTFVPGVTIPVLVNPLSPQVTDNVGWTGDTSGGTFNTLVNVAADATRRGCVFNTDVIAGARATFEDCIFFGGPPQTNRPGAMTAAAGANFIRCTFYGQPGTVAYYRNGINQSSGILNVTQSAFFRWVDMMHSTGGTVNTSGNLSDRFAFFDNDADHSSDPSHPYWTHNDFVQHLAVGGAHTHKGDLVWSRYDTTGMTWSGTPGASTASGGQIGMPATPANAGYWNSVVGGIYGNGYMFSNVSGHIATITDGWIEGGNNSSALISFTTGSTNQLVVKRMKFGIGGYHGSSTVRYLASWPSSTTSQDSGSGADVNIYAPNSLFPSVPVGIQGTPVTATSGGLRHVY